MKINSKDRSEVIHSCSLIDLYARHVMRCQKKEPLNIAEQFAQQFAPGLGTLASRDHDSFDVVPAAFICTQAFDTEAHGLKVLCVPLLSRTDTKDT